MKELKMRFFVLVLLFLSALSCQTSAAQLEHKQTLEVFFNGTTISEWYEVDVSVWSNVRYTRIVYEKDLFICRDYVQPNTLKVKIFCFDEADQTSD